jgi:hypothetical protein
MESGESSPVQGTRVRVQPVNKKSQRINGEELIAQVCYYYPQYDLDTAKQLSYRRVRLLLRVAQQQQAIQLYNLTQIAAAPHTKKGIGVKKLSDHFKKIADG